MRLLPMEDRSCMTDHGNQSLVHQARRWGAPFGLGVGAVVAGAVIGVATAADAHADGGDEVLAQAGQAFQGVLSADQALIAADQSGDLGSSQGVLSAELGVVGADFGVIPSNLDVSFADIGAEGANLFNIPDFFLF